MTLFREFLLLLVGGLLGAVLGAGFGALIAVISPDVIQVLAHPHPIDTPTRFGVAIGLVAGLLLGTAAMAAGRLIGAIRLVLQAKAATLRTGYQESSTT